jgi:isochorismate pyruvate lyase
MKSPHECKNIEEVRNAIDVIDNDIIDLIAKRYQYVKEIIKYKNTAEDVFARERYNSVINKRRELALKHKLDPDVIETMYKVLMDYFIKEQLLLLKNK